MGIDIQLSATLAPLRGVPTAIRARGVNHWFGTGETRTTALADVNIEIGRGEVVILTGPSGSGKTTLLTLIGALRNVQDGSLRVIGQEMGGLRAPERVAIRRKIGFIFQNHNLFSSLTAIENVRMATAMHAGATAERNRRARAILERLGLGERLHHRPAKLSGGQRQRVAIARALVNEPELVLADEPTASLDAKSGQEVLGLLHELSDGPKRTTVLIVTHDQRVLDRADRIVNLVGGRIVSNVRPEVSVRIVRALQAMPDLQWASVATLTHVADNMHVEVFRPGETVVTAGTPGDRWFLVGEGAAEAVEDGMVVRTLGPGDSFGVITALSQRMQPETVRARGALELFTMTGTALERVMAADPAIDSHVKRELMSRQ
jgi:putative ABC transport system ATP-binding protein